MKDLKSAFGGETRAVDAALRIAVVAAEIRLVVDERDEDAPSWADHLDLIAEALHP